MSTPIETLAFDDMSSDMQKKHKNVHGLLEPTWLEASTRWEQTFGDKTWQQVHEEDHTRYPREFAHQHRQPVGVDSSK